MDAASPHYTVLARRFRPQTFAEVVGQEHVAQALRNAIAAAGWPTPTCSRGRGASARRRRRGFWPRPSTAPTLRRRALQPVRHLPGISAGHDVDVLEIDGASNRGIDEIRQLAAERRRPADAGPVQDLHHRRSPHAHERGLQRPVEDARRAAAERQIHLLHDRAEQSSRSRFCRAASGSISPASPRSRSPSGCTKSPRPRGTRPSRRRWSCSPAARPARCATASRSWSNCWLSAARRSTAADVHRLLGTASDERLIEIAEAIVGRQPARALDLLEEALGGGVQLGEFVDQISIISAT